MNEILNNFSLAVDKFMPEMHLRKPGFTYIAAGVFPKINLKNTRIKRKRRFTIYLLKRAR